MYMYLLPLDEKHIYTIKMLKMVVNQEKTNFTAWKPCKSFCESFLKYGNVETKSVCVSHDPSTLKTVQVDSFLNDKSN